MLLYFILGSIAGIILIGVAIFPKLMKYRQEVLLMKKSVEQLESLNAELQFQSYEHIRNAPHQPQTRIVSIA
jgi:hypothetical protein